MDQRLLLTTTYLGPIDYFRQIYTAPKVVIEQNDHYTKQTYRNRCRIATSNHPLDLTIPVIRPKEKCPTKEIQISYKENWRINHWRAIESAYNSTPFFEYYRDDYEVAFMKKYNYLIDFNMDLLETTLRLLHISKEIEKTSEYIPKEDNNPWDMREAFHPKHESRTQITPYYQVFEHKFGFQPNLSIIDLLFNMGPEAIFTLRK
ncbi:MAG: WbqC family protein [Paludibacteraceae bacterium]|nr:WbqC family protein [Paludibacteraceae bacterium]